VRCRCHNRASSILRRRRRATHGPEAVRAFHQLPVEAGHAICPACYIASLLNRSLTGSLRLQLPALLERLLVRSRHKALRRHAAKLGLLCLQLARDAAFPHQLPLLLPDLCVVEQGANVPGGPRRSGRRRRTALRVLHRLLLLLKPRVIVVHIISR